MAQDAGLGCDAGDLGDRVDHAVGVTGRRTDQHDRALVESGLERRRVGAQVGAQRDGDALDIEVRTRLGKRRVGGFGRQDRGGQVAPGPSLVARDLHGQKNALRAAGADRSRPLRSAEQVARPGDDVALHVQQGAIAKRVEGVLVQEHVGDVVLQPFQFRIVGVVHQAERLATPPVEVVGALGAHRVEQLVNRRAHRGERPHVGVGRVRIRLVGSGMVRVGMSLGHVSASPSVVVFRSQAGSS